MNKELKESLNLVEVNSNRLELPKNKKFKNYAKVKRNLIKTKGKYLKHAKQKENKNSKINLVECLTYINYKYNRDSNMKPKDLKEILKLSNKKLREYEAKYLEEANGT